MQLTFNIGEVIAGAFLIAILFYCIGSLSSYRMGFRDGQKDANIYN